MQAKICYMRRLYFLLKLVCGLFSICYLPIAAAVTQSANAIQAPLSMQAQISLLTCSPNDEAVYTLYGHTALRVFDPETNRDFIFNYGVFDSLKPNFIYHFAKGETDYALGVTLFINYLTEYKLRGSEVCEQMLNLRPEEKESLWQALWRNSLPENRTYRYNFFFDNCATRPVVMIENNIRGLISYAPPTANPAFRDVINNCTREHPWVTFGCDLVLGLPTDRKMTYRETFFIPDYLKNSFDKAEIIRNGKSEPLVIQTNILAEESRMPEASPSPLTAPFTCFTLFFLVILLLTYNERRRKTYYRFIDCILFFFAGMGGCILFFLSFISVHPSIFPNMSLLWLHPLHLIGVVLFSVKKFNLIAFWYHLINFAVIFMMCVAWIFIPQHFNVAFIPLIASLLLRSGGALLRKKG